jgi:hypothetical protein
MLQTLPLRYSPSPQAQRQGALLINNKDKEVVKHLNSVLALPKNSTVPFDEDLRTLFKLTKVLGQTIDPRKHDKVELLIQSEREVAAELNSTPKEMGFSPRVSFLARLPIGRRVSEKDLSKSYILYSESRSEGGVEGRVSINIRNTDPLITRLEKLTQFNKVLNKYSNKTL